MATDRLTSDPWRHISISMATVDRVASVPGKGGIQFRWGVERTHWLMKWFHRKTELCRIAPSWVKILRMPLPRLRRKFIGALNFLDANFNISPNFNFLSFIIFINKFYIIFFCIRIKTIFRSVLIHDLRNVESQLFELWKFICATTRRHEHLNYTWFSLPKVLASIKYKMTLLLRIPILWRYVNHIDIWGIRRFLKGSGVNTGSMGVPTAFYDDFDVWLGGIFWKGYHYFL